MTTASHTPDDDRPGDDAPNGTVFTARVQNFVLGGMPGQGKSGAARWHMLQATPEIAETSGN